jgi:hypothetical protein
MSIFQLSDENNITNEIHKQSNDIEKDTVRGLNP